MEDCPLERWLSDWLTESGLWRRTVKAADGSLREETDDELRKRIVQEYAQNKP